MGSFLISAEKSDEFSYLRRGKEGEGGFLTSAEEKSGKFGVEHT